jgi:hypothetical protein
MYGQHVAALVVKMANAQVRSRLKVVVFLFLCGSVYNVIVIVPCDSDLFPKFVDAMAGPQVARLMVFCLCSRGKVLLV